MGEVITIGVDLAKSVFQVHGADAAGRVAVRRQPRQGAGGAAGVGECVGEAVPGASGSSAIVGAESGVTATAAGAGITWGSDLSGGAGRGTV